MEQFCTGVRATPAGTWLVGRREVGRATSRHCPRASSTWTWWRPPSPGEEESGTPPLQLPQRHAAIRRRSGNHRRSRLGADGVFPRSGAARRDRLPGSHAGRFQRLPAHRPAAPGKDNGQREQTVSAQRRPGQELAAARGRLHGRGESTGLGSHRASTARTKSGSGVISKRVVPMAAGTRPAERAVLFARPRRQCRVDRHLRAAAGRPRLRPRVGTERRQLGRLQRQARADQVTRRPTGRGARRDLGSQTFRYGPPEGP